MSAVNCHLCITARWSVQSSLTLLLTSSAGRSCINSFLCINLLSRSCYSIIVKTYCFTKKSVDFVFAMEGHLLTSGDALTFELVKINDLKCFYLGNFILWYSRTCDSVPSRSSTLYCAYWWSLPPDVLQHWLRNYFLRSFLKQMFSRYQKIFYFWVISCFSGHLVLLLWLALLSNGRGRMKHYLNWSLGLKYCVSALVEHGNFTTKALKFVEAWHTCWRQQRILHCGIFNWTDLPCSQVFLWIYCCLQGWFHCPCSTSISIVHMGNFTVNSSLFLRAFG